MMLPRQILLVSTWLAFGMSGLHAQHATVTVQTDAPGKAISPDLVGEAPAHSLTIIRIPSRTVP